MNAFPRFSPATMALTFSAAIALTMPSTEPAAATSISPVPAVPSAEHVPAPVAALHVQVNVGEHRITRSRSSLRPGNAVFDVRSRGGGSAAVQLLRLRSGYTLTELRHDNDSGDLDAIRRIDREVVFYGGMPVHQGAVSHFGARLDAGLYFLLDFDHPRSVRLRVEGIPERRFLPPTTGSVDMVLRHQEHRFRTPRRLPRSGWLRQTNRTDEPHFMDMFKVKRSTTREQVRRAFAGRGPHDPAWLLQAYPGTLVISPGHTVVWRYTYPRGKYLQACFWPSNEDGTPHAEMGMWNFITLR